MYERLLSPVLLLALAALALAGCGEDKPPLLTCPAKGIGVQAANGTSCSNAIAIDPKSAAAQDCLNQIQKSKEYDCTEPQICPDQGKLRYSDSIDPAAPPFTMTLTLTNCTGGPGKRNLVISGLAVAGDSRCSFKEPEVESREVKPGESIFVRLLYKAPAVGEDHAALHIISDAQNYKRLVIPICFKALPKGTSSPDAGSDPEAGPTRPDGGPARCGDWR